MSDQAALYTCRRAAAPLVVDGDLGKEEGQVWRIGLARTQMIDHRAHRYPAVWTPYPSGCPLPLMPDATHRWSSRLGSAGSLYHCRKVRR